MSSSPLPEHVKNAVEDLVRKTSKEITEVAERNSSALGLVGINYNYMGFLTVALIHTLRSMIETEEFQKNEHAKQAVAVGLHEIAVKLTKLGNS